VSQGVLRDNSFRAAWAAGSTASRTDGIRSGTHGPANRRDVRLQQPRSHSEDTPCAWGSCL